MGRKTQSGGSPVFRPPGKRGRKPSELPTWTRLGGAMPSCRRQSRKTVEWPTPRWRLLEKPVVEQWQFRRRTVR